MKLRGPLTDEQARARLAKLEAEEARLTREIDARSSKRTAMRKEADALAAQLRGQLPLPLASTRPSTAPRARRAA